MRRNKRRANPTKNTLDQMLFSHQQTSSVATTGGGPHSPSKINPLLLSGGRDESSEENTEAVSVAELKPTHISTTRNL